MLLLSPAGEVLSSARHEKRGWILPVFLLRSLRVRLVAIVLVIDCLAAALTGSVVVWKARTATSIEIASAMPLAEGLVADTIRLLKDAPAPVLLRSIDLHFQSVRHVRIAVEDAAGNPVEAQADTLAQAATREAPAWFNALIAPPIVTKEFPILVGGHRIGGVKLTSEPSDEIGEAWVYVQALLVTAAAMNIAVLGVLFLLFGYVLAPLTALMAGLKSLESKDYAVRLPRPSLLELATITDHFNSTAEALFASHKANRDLNRKLVTAQDDERRRTALELHDEAGPCLFALDVNAASIVSMTKALPDGGLIHERANDVLALIERVQSINRRVLDRLRPMALGQIPLRDCLFNLLVDLDGGAGPAIEPDIGRLRASYGVIVDLTIYRCLQEGLFNAIRHARATRVTLAVHDMGDRIEISIEDDGSGLQRPVRSGLGLAGMRERVEALSGQFDIVTSLDGMILKILLPLDTSDTDATSDPAASTEQITV